MSMSQNQKQDMSKKQKMFPCAICQKMTDQTCSLCLKVFYCSAEHQQIDWHIKHKMQCEGKIIQNSLPGQQWNTIQTQFNTSKDMSIPDNRQIQQKSNQIRLQNESKQFMSLFEERLIFRRKSVSKYLKAVQNKSTQQASQASAQLSQLCQISQNLCSMFKPGFIPVLEQMYGITTSSFILKLDQILDKALQAKYNLLLLNHEQVRRFLFTANQQIPLYPSQLDSRFRQIYQNVLQTTIKISQAHCNDKVSQTLMSKYVMVVQKFDGIWQQVYAYFNIGNWYLRKTYYQKAVKCFNHSLELLNTHKIRQNNEASTLVKSDLLFNVAICYDSLNKERQAFDFMQQSYRLRVKAVGKNSIQASECLECLSRWAFKRKDWQDSIQYAKQCYRVRRLNINYPQELELVEKLLEDIYTQLRKQKEKSQSELTTKPPKYYENLINPITINQQKSSFIEPQQSFIKQLNASRKQELIPFKVVITPQMSETYTLVQWDKLTKLLEITDKMMQKEEMRRIIFESEFTESLNEIQRDIFIKLNKVD